MGLACIRETDLEEGRRRDDALAAAAHDLQQPLTIIRGRAELLQRLIRRPDTDPVALTARLDQDLGRILAAVDQAASQVSDLLDAARPDARLVHSLQPVTFDLVALVRDVVSGWTSAAPRHAIRVDTRVPALRCHLDARRLRRVLDNLLSNAVKYSPPGSTIEIGLRHERAGRRQPDSAVITVRDHGIGIPFAALPRVFDRYYRAENVATTHVGTGLGLSSAREIVEQHGGTVRVESMVGEGTMITVRLPTAVAAGRPGGLPLPAQAAQPASHPARRAFPAAA